MPSNPPSLPRPFAAASPARAAPEVSRRLWAHPSWFLFVILTTQLMVVLDTSIVNVALPHIQRSLGFSGTSLSWVINAYILTFGGFLLLGARAGDLIGRRRALLLGLAMFTLSSLVGGLATAGWMLLVARAVQGLGGALAAPSALSLLTVRFPEGPERVRAIALYTTVSAAGAATGLVAGGLLTELASWRWVMFVNVPIGVATWILGRAVVVETERRHGRFDLFGATTSTLGMTSIVLALVEAGTRGWTSTVTITSLILGIGLLAVFVWHENRTEEPILPLRLVTHPARTTANAARGLVYAGMYGMFFFMSQFLQDVQRYSSLRAGFAFLPIPVAVFFGSQLTSRKLVRRFTSKTVMMSGIACSAIGLLLAVGIQTETSYPRILVSFLLLGTGAGISFVSLMSASLADVATADAGAASGLVNVSQQLGAALGLAVLVSVFGIATHHSQIGATVPRATLSRANAVLVHGLHDVFGLGIVFTLGALVLVASLIRDRRASGATETAQVVDLENEFARREELEVKAG